MNQLQLTLRRLRKPSVMLSLISQVVAILVLLGYPVQEDLVMGVAVSACSVLVLLGIMSNPDTKKKGYGDDLLQCANSGLIEQHTMINGEMICTKCGAVYEEDKEQP